MTPAHPTGPYVRVIPRRPPRTSNQGAGHDHHHHHAHPRGRPAPPSSAGLLFIGVQINHPHLDVAFITTTEWKVRQTMKVLMAVLSLAGITGMYLRQVKQTGVLGLIGYLAARRRLPHHAEHRSHRPWSSSRPSPAAHPATSTTSSPWPPAATPTGDIGLMQPLSPLAGFTYLAGGLLFGIALFRANILARWAAALLAVGAVATVAIPLLPQVNFSGCSPFPPASP